ncbi:glycosyltransferase family 2 protein [Croceibacterium sp. TMG7-5b_MA50]|uniref:glycosyltransferase family 2 protein n=1 Tax=Croceibacterium sp. TMG7-5b_MA50 TaxID=3121290 RepID=UPI0032213AE2
MDVREELVSVIIPAYNAAATITETLESVRAQTYRALDIIVVDDGSSDDTRALAEAQAALDPRIRVITQKNGGVAAARNHGLDVSQGAFVAPVDADDLWRPRKIERQMRAMRAGGPETGLVYCWSAVIDGHGTITSRGGRPVHEGDVLPQLFVGNFVGNGSCALMRRDLVIEAGGYDPGLRAQRAQGCEDWKLYLLLAERSLFTVIRDHLVGYRALAGSMSGDAAQMLRSDAIVRAEMLERHPHSIYELDYGRRFYIDWLIRESLTNRNWQRASSVLEEKTRDGSVLGRAKERARLGARFLKYRLDDRKVFKDIRFM